MDVVRDVLDKQVVDRNGREMGRVDGIVLDWRDGEPPRLSAALIGPPVLGHRLHPTIGRWVAALERALGLDRGRPVSLEFDHLAVIDRGVRTDLSVGDTSAETVERGLRRWLANIPGA